MQIDSLPLDVVNNRVAGLPLANFPVGPRVVEMRLASPTFYYSATLPADAFNPVAHTINVYDLRVLCITGRWKRCFILCRELNADMKPVLVVGLPGTTQVGGDGCKEMWRNTPNVPVIDNRWIAQVVRDQNCFGVVIDRANGAFDPTLRYDPNDGETLVDQLGLPYPGNAYDPLVEDIAVIEAARHFINHAPMLKLHPLAKGLRLPLIEQMMVGGLSWGSLSASMLLAACPQFIAGYLAGMYMNADWYNGNPAYRAGFNPIDWRNASPPINYKDVYLSSKAKEIVFSWGSADDAYVNYDKPYVDATVAALQAAQPGKFVKNISTVSNGAHVVDLLHCRTRFADWMNRLTGTSWSVAVV